MTEEPQRGHSDDDLWSWIDQDEADPGTPEIDPSAVTAVMVVHDAEEWLPRQLLSLAGLAPRPGLIVAVDAGSTDRSPDLLARARDEGVIDELLTGDDSSFGQAVSLALADGEPEWLWLLHDDSAPNRDTLAHLLDGARLSDVVVPKLLEPRRRNYPATISEIGQAITPGGLRVPMVEGGEIDQHQSESQDLLGASTAGLLIRGEVWREVGGISPEVARHRDGVDLCWRINAVGFRVLGWPAAALTHRRAGHTGERPDHRHPHEDDRLAALRVAGSRGASTMALAGASVARAAGFLLAKSPAHSLAELRALGRYRQSRDQTQALADRLPAEDLTPPGLLPERFWPVRNTLDRVGNAISQRYRDLTEKEADTSLDELTGDDFAGVQRRATKFPPITALVVVLLLAAAVAGRTLLGGGVVAGGGLLPPPASIGAAWDAYLTGDAPWLGFAAAASVLGTPRWFAVAALLLAPLFAGGAALALLRRLDVTGAAAAGLAGVWAGAVLLLGLVTAGDVTGMVLAVVGPMLARSVHTMITATAAGTDRLRAPAGVAFWLILGSVVWPVLLILATIAASIWAVRNRERLLDAAIAVLPGWLFLAPWLPTLMSHPGRWVTGTDPMAWPDYPPASFAMVLGRILPSGMPVWANIAFFAILGLVSVVSLARAPRRRWLGMVSAIAVPLLLGTLLSRFVVSVDGGAVRVLTSPWALLVVAALLAPVVVAERGEAARRPVVLSLALATVLAAGTWAVTGFQGPVDNRATALPSYVRDVVHSVRDTRVLMVELAGSGHLAWNVVDPRQPRWGSGETSPAGSFADDLYVLVQSFVSGAVPEDLAEEFRSLGVSHVWLRGFDADQRAVLDNAAGLTSAPVDDDTAVWTVVGLVSRSYVISDEGREPVVEPALGPSGDDGRWIELAEPEDANWVARLDGERLERLTGTGRLGFHVGTASGDLVIEPARHLGRLVLHVLILVGLAILAAPSMGGATAARRGRP